MVTLVLKFGLNHAFFRHYYEAEEEDHRRKIVGSTLIFLFVSSLLLTALLCLAAPQVSRLIFGLCTADREDGLFLLAVLQLELDLNRGTRIEPRPDAP